MAKELSDKIPLTAAIAALRKELKEAAEAAARLGPEEARFRVSAAEIELTIVAEDSATADGEVGWWIFKAKAGVGIKDAVTHKVKLTLNVGDIEVGSSVATP